MIVDWDFLGICGLIGFVAGLVWFVALCWIDLLGACIFGAIFGGLVTYGLYVIGTHHGIG